MMVNSDERLPQHVGQRLAGLEPDPERAGQPRPAGCRNRADLIRFESSSSKRRTGDRQKIAQVLSRGEFGNNAAVIGVQPRL